MNTDKVEDFRPIEDLILVRPIKEEKVVKVAGLDLVLTDHVNGEEHDKYTDKVEILKLGGKVETDEFKPGDIMKFSQRGVGVYFGDEIYLLVTVKELHGVIEPSK